jgi:membrane protein DedA with SNARE-associated domain
MELYKLLVVAGMSIFKVLPAVGAAAGLQMNFWEIFVSIFVGGSIGNLIFSVAGSRIRAWLKARRKRLRRSRKPNIRRWRRIVRIWKKFGLVGIAFLTPPLLSPPIGNLIAVGFREKPKRILLHMTVSLFVWAVIFGLFGKQISDFIGNQQ